MDRVKNLAKAYYKGATEAGREPERESERAREMDKIRKVAKAYYNGATEAGRELARQLFQSLDTNGDGKVSLDEYKKLVHPFFSNDDIFKELDKNGDETLDFDEVLALYYMDKVSLPSCNNCGCLLMDSYFSCLPCQANVSYYLCCDCYGEGKVKHQHSWNEFMDTRAMLKLLDQLLKKKQKQSDHDLLGVDELVEKVVDKDDVDEDEEVEDEDIEDDHNLDADLMDEEKTNRNGKAGRKQSTLRSRTKGQQQDDDTEGSSNRSKRKTISGTLRALNVAVSAGSAALSAGSAALSAGSEAVVSNICCIM